MSRTYRKHAYGGNFVSDFFYLGPSFNFMNSRKIIMDKYFKMNVLNMPCKLKVCTINSKRDILDRKIKVKKSFLNFPVS